MGEDFVYSEADMEEIAIKMMTMFPKFEEPLNGDDLEVLIKYLVLKLAEVNGQEEDYFVENILKM